MSRQVRRLTDQVYDAAFLDLPTRLAKALLSLAGTEAETGNEVSLRATQLEVANMIGATRESVNKWLHFYQKRGLVRLGRGTITISRERDLKAYASPYPYI
jgi:CRP-like cAMP-binding protein